MKTTEMVPSALRRNYNPVTDLEEIFHLEDKVEIFFSTFLTRFSQKNLKNSLAPSTSLPCLDHRAVE